MSFLIWQVESFLCLFGGNDPMWRVKNEVFNAAVKQAINEGWEDGIKDKTQREDHKALNLTAGLNEH